MDQRPQLLKVYRHLDAECIGLLFRVSDKDHRYVRRYGLYCFYGVLCRHAEGLRVNDDGRVGVLDDLLDSIGRIIGKDDIVSLVAEDTVEAFDQYRVLSAEKDVVHDTI